MCLPSRQRSGPAIGGLSEFLTVGPLAGVISQRVRHAPQQRMRTRLSIASLSEALTPEITSL